MYLATSADGYIARPDGSVDWLDRPRPKGDCGMAEFQASIDTMLYGRKTLFPHGFPPTAAKGKASKTKVEGEIAAFIIHVIPVFGEGIPLIAPRRRQVPLALESTRSTTTASCGCTIRSYVCPPLAPVKKRLECRPLDIF